MILWGREQDTEEQGRLLESLGIPFMVKGRHEVVHPEWNQVDFDHEWMMANAVHHLFSIGHQRLAYIGFPLDDAFVSALKQGYLAAYRAQTSTDPDTALIGEFEDEVPSVAHAIRGWLGLPSDQAPTAFVVAAGNAAWRALEIELAATGQKLQDKPRSFSACGVTAPPFSLIFGDAMVYESTDMENLPRFLAVQWLDTWLDDLVTEPVVRYRPPLVPADSLRLLDHGVHFTSTGNSATSTSSLREDKAM